MHRLGYTQKAIFYLTPYLPPLHSMERGTGGEVIIMHEFCSDEPSSSSVLKFDFS
jgi:hypothetical protein